MKEKWIILKKNGMKTVYMTTMRAGIKAEKLRSKGKLDRVDYTARIIKLKF